MKIRVNKLPEIAMNKDVPPVTSPQIYDSKTGFFHPDGLFSEQIFGPVKNYECQCGLYKGKQYEGQICPQCGVRITSNMVRRITYSRIELPVDIPHPQVLYYLFSQNKELKNALYGSDYSVIYDIINAIVNSDNPKIQNLVKSGNAFTNIIPVIPPDLRPLKNKYNVDDINSYYVSILNYVTNHSLKYAEEQLKVILTKRYYGLFNYVYERIPKKSGLIRQTLLGKETDFSARTVIVPDPTLPLDTIRVSKWILFDLLRPWIIHHLVSYNINPTFTNHVIDESIRYRQSEDFLDQALMEILDRINAQAVFNRQPTLHRGSLMGFRIVPGNDDTIGIHPVVCPPYNADFNIRSPKPAICGKALRAPEYQVTIEIW